MSRSISIVAVLLLSAGVAWGQTPFVENLLVPNASYFNLSGPFDYTDIPHSIKTITIPAGTAFITWSVDAQANGSMFLRPVIGGHAPVEGTTFEYGGANASGSWATQVDGGEVTVKLQVREKTSNSFHLAADGNSMSWTLIVFPETAGNVPAVGNAGLGVMVVLLLAVGGFVIKRRQRQAA